MLWSSSAGQLALDRRDRDASRLQFLKPIEFRLPKRAAAIPRETPMANEFWLSAVALIVCHRRERHRIRPGMTSAVTVLTAQLLLDGQAQVVQQMEPIGDLARLRCATSRP